MTFFHETVLLKQTIELLDINPEGIYIDGTAGAGNASEEIAKRLKGGRLISIDQDPDAVKAVTERLSEYKNATVVESNFSKLDDILDSFKIEKINGALFDIGVSSHQLDTPERGFSFHSEGNLDMRMSQSGISAADIIAGSSWQELAHIFRIYGEEKFAAPIARAICSHRDKKPIVTTLELSEIISHAVPAAVRREGHPARRVFQALRYKVNQELEVLEEVMNVSFRRLAPNGRLAVIAFNSLESRIVKNMMNDWCTGCECAKLKTPVCICGKTAQAKMATRKPVMPSQDEINRNPRCRSAILRVCEKI